MDKATLSAAHVHSKEQLRKFAADVVPGLELNDCACSVRLGSVVCVSVCAWCVCVCVVCVRVCVCVCVSRSPSLALSLSLYLRLSVCRLCA